MGRRRDFNSLPPESRLGDAPVEEAYHAKMQAIMQVVDEFANEGVKGKERKIGIVLMMFPYGEAADGRCNYMSNGADRKDIVTLMKEMIARFEGQPDVSGRA